ncbi:RNA polymerase sigma factor [Pseudahrensia aquimaris]|uniref:RNA polymerase sigma factor n=1 Tax=Pseudahrensia aquimaris TaxID=744461 RepID=A0ABW3FF40_9HYPH
MHTDDPHLIGRIAAGDKDAMRVFFESHEGPLLAFLKGRGADPQTADDVMQDAMLEVWRSASKFAERSKAKTWLFAIARNKLIDRQRKSSRMSLVEDVPEIVDETPDAEAVMISAADTERVRTCLSKLKPDHLTAIRLAFYEDMSYAEIGEIEGAPVGTIKTRIYHAKKLLLWCLGRR